MSFYSPDFVPSNNPLAFALFCIWIALIAFGTLPLMTYIETLKHSRSKRFQKMGRLIYWVLFPAFVVISGSALIAWNISS